MHIVVMHSFDLHWGWCCRWVDMLVHRGLNDRVLVHDVPERVHQRIAIPREELDKQLDGTTGGALNTWLKNTTHAVGGYMK